MECKTKKIKSFIVIISELLHYFTLHYNYYINFSIRYVFMPMKGSRVAIKKVVKKKVDLNKKLLWEIKQVSLKTLINTVVI